MVKQDQRKRTQDDLSAFPMHLLFVACLSWNPKSSHGRLPSPDVTPDHDSELNELADSLPDPMWSYDPSADDAAIYTRCAAAVSHLILGANRGDPLSQLYLGCLYGSGWGVAQDYVVAVDWLRKSADQGNATAQLQLGTCYEYGEGVAVSAKQAVYWWEMAARQGDMISQSRLAHAILSNYGFSNDQEHAYKWFRNAAEQGERYAQYQMGEYYEGELQGDGNRLGYEPELAFQWFLKAAEQGCEWSQDKVARSFKSGRGTNKDLVQAAFWYRRIAESNSPNSASAQYELGRCFQDGFGVEKSLENAVACYTSAAHKGDMSAQLCLGQIYENEEYLKQDYSQALYWYSKALEQNQDAQLCRKIGEWYLRGEVVPKNEKLARRWLNKFIDEATKLGCYDSARQVKQMISEGFG